MIIAQNMANWDKLLINMNKLFYIMEVNGHMSHTGRGAGMGYLGKFDGVELTNTQTHIRKGKDG